MRDTAWEGGTQGEGGMSDTAGGVAPWRVQTIHVFSGTRRVAPLILAYSAQISSPWIPLQGSM